jgi:MFS family permease
VTTATTQTGSSNALQGVHPQRLFVASCMSLISTAVAFGVVTSFLGQLKAHFGLNNEQVGWIGGAALWGFTISIFILGPLCDALGMKTLMRIAFLTHFIGVITMITAVYCPVPFWPLFIGALIIAIGNGTVEAACNPLVATIFPNDKTHKLNQFHMWFPGGIVIGGLAAFAIDTAMPDGSHNWQIKLAIVLIPTIVYGILFMGQKFPATERVQSGISFGGMVKETFSRPLFIILFFCMMITASLELGPGRWMGEAMTGAVKAVTGLKDAGILVLVYGSVLMAVLRFFAGPVVHKLSPTGLLVVSAILAGAGLYLLTTVHTAGAIIGAATVFYFGVCYFWPTMLGTAAERVPKGGALALAILGGTGMAVVGLVTVPLMGAIADSYVKSEIPVDKTQAILTQVATSYPQIKAVTPDSDMATRGAYDNAINSAQDALKTIPNLDKAKAVSALRAAVQAGETLHAATKGAQSSEPSRQAGEIIKAADEYGSVMSFRWISASAIVLVVVFGILYLSDLAKGGYKAEKITAA